MISDSEFTSSSTTPSATLEYACSSSWDLFYCYAVLSQITCAKSHVNNFVKMHISSFTLIDDSGLRTLLVHGCIF